MWLPSKAKKQELVLKKFFSMRKPIAISLSPNTEKEDVFLALKLLFSPWKLFKSDNVFLLEQWFHQYFGVSYAVTFNSGRSALYAILKALNIGPNDEVILQSFTCVAVPNSIIWTGAKPIFVDVESNLTIDVLGIEKKITKKTKAIIVQHTFGIPSDILEIRKIARKYKLFVIEDCAHIIEDSYENKKLGLFGEASFFSFGRDKAFSSVFGGMAITNNEDIGKKIRVFQKKLKVPSFFWTIQQIFHPIAFFFILPIYDFMFLGKIMLVFLQKLYLLSFPVSTQDKNGNSNTSFLAKLPNPLAELALTQLKKIKKYNEKRINISSYYLEELTGLNLEIPYKRAIPFLRFPILVENRDELIKFFRKKGIYLGTWYSNIIDPKGVDFKKIYFQPSLFPSSIKYAKQIVNLPVYPTMAVGEMEKVVSILKNYVSNSRNK